MKKIFSDNIKKKTINFKPPVLLIQRFKGKTEMKVNGTKIEVLNCLTNIVDHVLHLEMFDDIDRLAFLTLVPKVVLSDDKK